jgi:hypothetical protein
MEMETSLQQMMAHLLAEMKADINAKIEAIQEKADADAKAPQEKADADAKARHEEAAARQKKANAELKAEMHSMRSDIERSLHQQMGALLEGSRSFGTRTRICRVPPATCQTETSYPEEMDATRLEASPEETEVPLERKELFKEEINIDNIGASEDRCKDQRLDAQSCRGAKKRSQDSVGSRQKLSACRKRVISRAIPAVRKGNIRKCPGKDNVARRASRRKTHEDRQRNNYECKNGRWDRDLKKRLRLRTKRTSDTCYMKPTIMEMANLIFGSTIELQSVNDLTFWKVRPPPKSKKELRTV